MIDTKITYRKSTAPKPTLHTMSQELIKHSITKVNIKKKIKFAEFTVDGGGDHVMTPDGTPLAKSHTNLNWGGLRKTGTLKSSFSGHQSPLAQVSILSVYVKTLNRTIDLVLNESDTIEGVKVRIFKKMEDSFGVPVNHSYYSRFSFLINQFELQPENDFMKVKVLLQHEEHAIKDLIKGNTLSITLVIREIQLEEEFLNIFLEKLKNKDDHLIQVVKRIKKNKSLGNYLLIVSEKLKATILTITSLKGKIKASFNTNSHFDVHHRGSQTLKGVKLEETDFIITDVPPEEKYPVYYSTVEQINELKKTLTTLNEEKNLRPSKTRFSLSDMDHQSKERFNMKIDEQDYSVKLYGLLGIKSDRILKLTPKYEMELYEPKGKNKKFTHSYSIKDLESLKPKREGSQKIVFTFKNPKKQKPVKLHFLQTTELTIFLETYNKLITIIEGAKTSVLTENIQRDFVKRYSWFQTPVRNSITKFTQEGKATELIFSVINVTDKEAKQKLRIDLGPKVIEFLTPLDELVKTLRVSEIKYIEQDCKDFRKVNLKLDSKKITLIFSNIRSRILFESAVHFSTMPKYVAPATKPNCIEKVDCFVTTFNVGEAEPPKDLSLWLKKSLDCKVIAIGLQESKTASWIEAIQKFYPQDKFTLINVMTMWMMMVCVFVENSYVNYVTNIEADYKATGIANIIGNKGGVGISFNIMETSFCFISSHLAAKPQNMHLRKHNLYDIFKNMRFGDKQLEIAGQYDYFFYMGDTNFRVDYLFEDAVQEIQAGNYDNLKRNCQYAYEKKMNQFLNVFNEGLIKFKPTYRRQRDETGYSNKNGQCPSWTDRIYWKSQPRKDVKLKDYNSVEMFFCSDHRPVNGIYEVLLEPPFLPLPPIHLRPNFPGGVLKFKKLILDYNLTHYQMIGEDFEAPLPSTVEFSLHFSAKFLSNYCCTLPLKIVEKCGPWQWNEEAIPLLHLATSDSRYLKEKYILSFLTITTENGEVMMGQASIPLYDSVEQGCTLVNFTAPIHLYGKEFGSLYGECTYDLEDLGENLMLQD
jgi:hypothetical protein